MIHYSKMNNAFYTQEIHGENIPIDGVEITEEYYDELLDGQASGQMIVADDNGYPILLDRPPLSAEELQKLANAEARAYLDSTDWYVIRFIESGVAVPEDITLLRQQARDSVVET